MKRYRSPQVWMAGLTLAALVMVAVAPAAEAKKGHSRRYKHKVHTTYRHVVHSHSPRVVEIRRSSDSFAALVGFIGGYAVGALSRPEPHYVYPSAHPYDHHYYYDPYCRERFVSLEIYHSHLRHHHHPRVVRVIDVRSGDCVHTYRYRHGGWEVWDDDWEERYYDD